MKTKKILATAAMTISCILMFGMTAFAYGTWRHDGYGWWYDHGDGRYPKSTMKNIDDEYYIFDKHGYCITSQWTMYNGQWYYATGSGVVATSQWIGDYYVGEDGIMLTDCWTPDGYYVDSTGKWDKSKSKNGSSDATDEYFTIDGNWDNRDQSGFSKDKRVDMWIEVDPGDAYLASADFGLYMSSGTPYSLYDKENPNGDCLKLGTVDGLDWGARSTISDKWYDLEYNGKDTITLKWRSTQWTNGNLVFKRRSGGRLLHAGTNGSVG
ncbi:MAG: hypothetical protein E7232_09420 [Lachnospiraceae bacterium]|nr:hypothetical protein [Lachnospiraceae bacterium]